MDAQPTQAIFQFDLTFWVNLGYLASGAATFLYERRRCISDAGRGQWDGQSKVMAFMKGIAIWPLFLLLVGSFYHPLMADIVAHRKEATIIGSIVGMLALWEADGRVFARRSGESEKPEPSRGPDTAGRTDTANGT